MAVLVVSVDFPPHTDGVSRVSGELALWLRKSGEEVVIIGPQDKGAKEYDALQRFISYRTPFYNWGYLRLIPIIFCMPYVIWKYKIKKVFPMNIAYGGILAFFLSKIVPLSYTCFAYGYEFRKFEKNPVMKKLLLAVYARAKQIFAITNFVKDELIRFGVAEHKIVIIRPGVQLDKFKPICIANDRKTLLTVSRLVDRKGHDIVLQALSIVKQTIPDVLYCIVGFGPMENILKDMCKQLDLENNVEFLGKVPDEKLVHYYNLCNVFIMVSRDIDRSGQVEGFGIVYLEANACGKPVIGGRTGGVSEAILDKETGLLVNPLDVQAVAAAILRLLQDKSYAEQLGRNGLNRVNKDLHWDRYFQEFSKLCE